MTGLNGVLDEDKYSGFGAGSYAGVLVVYGVLCTLGFLLIWPLLHSRRIFRSLERRYKNGRHIVGGVVGEEVVSTLAEALDPPEKCGTCCSSELRQLVVTYDSGKHRMLKAFYVTQSTYDAASQTKTFPMFLIPGVEKSAVPATYLHDTVFGCIIYAFLACFGGIFLVWAAYFGIYAIFGGTALFKAYFSTWFAYLSWAVLAAITLVALLISYILCRILTQQERHKYVDGGAKYVPSWRSWRAESNKDTAENEEMTPGEISWRDEDSISEHVPKCVEAGDGESILEGISMCSYSIATRATRASM